MNTGRERELAGDSLEETRFFPITLDEIDPPAGPFFQQKSKHETGKAAAGTEIEPTESSRGKWHELCAVQDMAVPDVVQSRWRRKINAACPSLEHGLEGQEFLECFT